MALTTLRRTITESDLYTTIITQNMLIAHELGNFTKSVPVIVTLTMSDQFKNNDL